MGDFRTLLKAVSWEQPESVIQTLDLIHFHFGSANYKFASSNKIFKWGEEFEALNLSFDEKLQILNTFFFEKEKFSINKNTDAPIFLDIFFKTKQGHPYLVSLVYQYLIQKLGIQSSLWCEKRPHLIRISTEGRSLVIDLESRGQRASGETLNPPPFSTEPIKLSKQFYYLLSDLADTHLFTNEFEKTLFLYDCVLSLKPDEIFWYARRGLLRKNLGYFSEAVNDLNRYIDFARPEEVSPSILNALVELKGLKYVNEDILAVHH